MSIKKLKFLIDIKLFQNKTVVIDTNSYTLSLYIHIFMRVVLKNHTVLNRLVGYVEGTSQNDLNFKNI